MEIAEFDELSRVLDSSISRSQWRPKTPAKRRLVTDILALCTGMRPVVMVDYGGKMPVLQDRLCAVLKLSQKESCAFKHLRVMVIEEMIYLIHTRSFAEHIRSSLCSESEVEPLFVDLHQDPPKMITKADNNTLVMQLVSIQKYLSSIFSFDGVKEDLLPTQGTVWAAASSADEVTISGSSEYIDLSCCMQETQVTIPTLNGWLLGYPVVYLFSKEHIQDAIRVLSTRSLRLFKIFLCRKSPSGKGSQEEELMSFSVPYELSMEGSSEPWAVAFVGHLLAKQERCQQTWRSLKMEVSQCCPQAIVL